MDRLKWTLEFDLKNDGAGLKKADQLLGNVQNKIGGVSNQIGGFSKQFQGLSSSMGGLSSGFGNLGSMMSGMGGILSGVISVAVKAFQALDDFTDKAVSAFTTRNQTLRTYTTILGDATKAQERFNYVSALALNSEAERKQLQGVDTRLAVAGYRGQEANRALLTIADLVTVAPNEEKTVASQRLSKAFGDIKGKGYLQQEELNQFEGLLSQRYVKEEVAKELGVSLSKVDDKLRKREITSDVGIRAIEKASLRQLNTSKAGEFATSGSGDIGTMLSNQKEALQNALLAIDPDTLASYDAYKKSIQGVTDALNETTETGKNVKYVLEYLSDLGMSVRTFFNEFVTGFIDSFAKNFRETFETFKQTFGQTKDDINSVSVVAKGLGTALGYLGKTAAYIAGYFSIAGRAIDYEVRKWQELKAWAADTWEYIKDKTMDIWDGLKELFGGLYDMVSGIIHLSLDEIQRGLDRLSGANYSSRTAGKDYEENMNRLKWTRAAEDVSKMAQAFAKSQDKQKKDAAAAMQAEKDKAAKSKNGVSGEFVNFDNFQGGVLKDLNLYMQSFGFKPNLPGGKSLPYVPGPQKLPTIKPIIQIDKFEQNITGDGASPKEIAQEAYTLFTQEIGRRIVRSPMPLTT